MDNILDDSWVKSAFLLPSDAIIGGNEAVVNRIYSTSMQKASDTTLGGNFVINPLPQFTRYADLKHNVFSSGHARGKTVLVPKVSRSNETNSTSSNGMGRTYSEKIDDNMQVVHFRMGFPTFNSMSSFYSNYYSIPAASMARAGRAPGFFYTLGWTMGSIATIPLMPFVMAGKVLKFFFRRPASKYYYLKPSMLPYWTAVSSMVNGVAANMGIIPRPIYEGAKHLYDKEDGIDQRDIDEYARLIPSIYRKDGGLDVFAIAQRGQRLVNARQQLLNNELKNLTSKEQIKETFKRRLYGDDLGGVFDNMRNNSNATLEAYTQLWRDNEMLGKMSDEDAQSNRDTLEKEKRLDDGLISQLEAAFLAEARMGSEFLSLRVDFTGTQAESFNNSTKDASIGQQINSISASARETRFSMFDGNIDSGGLADAAFGALKDMVGGITQGLGIQGLAQLSGSAYVDIPKVWDSSSCDFNKLTLNIPLRSPYGDPISRLQNLILPMCCIFAMSVPLATGKQSHTAPFLIEYFAQGRAHSRLAIVDSLTITRGQGDIGWNNNGGFLGVDIQLGLLDLTNAINMPINPSFEFSDRVIQAAGYGIGKGVGFLTQSDVDVANIGTAAASMMLGSTYDDDNNYTDYLAILAGLPLEAEINGLRKWAVRLARQQAAFDDAKSPERAAMWAMSGMLGEGAKAIAMATGRQ